MNDMTKVATALPKEVTLATPADFDEMFDFILHGYRESAIYSLAPHKVGAWLLMALSRDHAMVGIIRGPKGIEAAIALYLATFWYTEDVFLEEVFNFVKPEYRRTKHWMRLIDFAKWSAEGLRVPLHMGILTTSRLAGKERLYKRKLTKVGASFIHGIPWVEESLHKNP